MGSQVGGRPYEETQRNPGDYEAQIGQRPIAVHALEHLGATDKGVIMYRQMVREGIQAVKMGEDPVGVYRDTKGVIPTSCNDSVVYMPPAHNPEEDQRLLRETGRKLAKRYIETSPISHTDIVYL